MLSVAETGCGDCKQTDIGNIFQDLRNGIFIALQSNSVVDMIYLLTAIGLSPSGRLLPESSVRPLLAK